jgi:hypothetical protein
MKDSFKGFYNVEEKTLENLWKNEKTLFVFDTNVLLNLYGYAIQTRDDFFKILQAVSDKIWIPYHVGLEYQRRRLSIIKNEKGVFKEVESNLDKIQKVFKGDFEQLALKRRFPKLSENTDKLEKEINKAISNYKKSVSHWDGEQACVRSHDEIRSQLNSFFEEKVGDKPESQEWLNSLYKDGADRYKKKIPPGFKDSGKSQNEEEKEFTYDGLLYERQFGDLILWKQLLAKSQDDNIENVIFITDDSKEDWWYKINSNGKKIIGPLAELQAEIYRECNIKNFHMYSTSSFLEDGKSNLEVEVNESSIVDANTSHVTHFSKKRTPQEIMDLISNSPSIDNEKVNRILNRSYESTALNNERLNKILEHQYKSPSLDNERINRILESQYKSSALNNERLNEILNQQKNLSAFNDEKVREKFNSIIESYNSPKEKSAQEYFEALSKFSREIDSEDSEQ